MRPIRLAALAFLAAAALPAPALAQSQDQFGNIVPPSLNYDNPAMRDLYANGSFTRLARLQQVCQGQSLKDRKTCNRAWAEINAAYAQLQTRKARTR
jgi:hypothetical protein